MPDGKTPDGKKNDESGTVTVQDGPATEKEIKERQEAIREAIKAGEPIPAPKEPRPAKRKEVNLAKRIRPAVVTVVVSAGKKDYTGQGTGFIITESGLLVTNQHVVDKIKSAKAILSDGRVLDIKSVLISDKTRDLAILQLPKSKYPFLRLAPKKSADVGDDIAVMGSPKGLSNTYSVGIISSIRDREKNGVDLLQISAPVSPGSSGSPVVGEAAMVVGVVQGGITSKNAQSLNFAIDVGELHDLLNEGAKGSSKPVPIAVTGPVKDSKDIPASNERSDEDLKKQPDTIAIVQEPEDGGKVTWIPQQVKKPIPPIKKDSRLSLEELDRKILGDGKISIRLKMKIKGEKAELSELKNIKCQLDKKTVTIAGNILTIVTDKGIHDLKISWTAQSGKKHVIESRINIGIINIE